ncbi:gamma carbonic anhydrase family protein [Nocardia sp. NPDC056000]|uniref:gamma carbonic anhydrase family protein n=1 Tax=Nocardia sp. NPDC056000 TaxID=3345674 RepID=UPI0035DCBF42
MHPDAVVSTSATLIGDVVVEADCSIGHDAVLRGDLAPVLVRSGATIQNGAVLHAPAGAPVEIGRDATIANRCCVQGARIGARTVVADGAIILTDAIVGADCAVAAGAVVLGGTCVPDRMLITGRPATGWSPRTTEVGPSRAYDRIDVAG